MAASVYSGETPLYAAARCEHLPIVEHLTERGAAVDAAKKVRIACTFELAVMVALSHQILMCVDAHR